MYINNESYKELLLINNSNKNTMKESLTQTLENMRKENLEDYIEMRIEIELFELQRSIEHLKEFMNDLFEKKQRESRINY